MRTAAPPIPTRRAPPLTPAPYGSLWDSLSFMRDPACFTAGPGRRLGDFYRLRVPAYDLHVVTHPDVIAQILVSKGSHFEKSRLYWGQLKRIIGEAMASLEGERWRYLRGLEQPYFTPKKTADYLPAASDLTRLEFDGLRDRVGDGLVLPALEIVSRLNTRLVLALYFGQDGGEERLEITRRIVDGEETIAWRSKFPWRSATGWLNGRNARAKRHRAYFQAYADRAEASEAAASDRHLIGALRRMRAEPGEPRFPHSLLRNEMIVHLGASTETQGVAEAWCLHLLWRHSDALRRVRDEVDRVAGSEPVAIRHVPQLTFTLQVIRETLRLYPTAYGVVRDCVEPTDLCGHPAERRQVFFISLLGLHRSPRLWTDPDRFDPDRFAAERLGSLSRHQYMPFGGGRHVCIGQHFALPAMVMAIGQLAQRFEWAFRDRDVRGVGKATFKPRGPFLVELKPRTR